MLCTEHPLHIDYPDLKSELMRSWSFKPRPGAKMNWRSSFYQPRYQGHSYNAPATSGGHSVTRYHGMDIFVAFKDPKIDPCDDYITLELQRPAMVYYLVPKKASVSTEMAGWAYEGTAKMVERRNKAIFGVYRQKRWHLPKNVHVFSRRSVDDPDAQTYTVLIPSLDYIAADLGARITVLIAESDGVASEAPENMLGFDSNNNIPNIPAGGRCPELLHDVWKIEGHDPDDEQTRGMSFRTYHPLWDPCYFCAYDHEHGSDVVRLMGYHPRFGYAALKNYEQDESHKGFKGHVMRVDDDHHLYYQVHAHLSRKGRFTTRTHTVVIVVANAVTHAIEVELTYKQDYGFASTKRSKMARGKGLLAVSTSAQEMKESMARNHTFGSRQMNFYDANNQDMRFKRPSSRGTNEHWFCRPICSDVGHVKVDFKNPATAAVSGYDNTLVKLGGGLMENGDVKRQSTSHRRDISITNRRPWRLEYDLCKFTLDNIHGVANHGRFYTDPDAKKLFGSTGDNHMMQYFKPGFKISINGTYNAVDTWAGLHMKNSGRGFMQDIGLAIDPAEN